MNKNFSVISCQRNGSHCIANWLLHQNKNIVSDHKLENTQKGLDVWQITSDNKKYTGFLINNPEKPIDITPVGEYCRISLYENGRSVDLRKNQVDKFILVLRDFRNFAASIFFKHSVIHKHVIQSWMDRAKIIVNLKNQPSNYYFINYNKWYSDKDYRIKLCSDLDLDFTDFGYKTIPHFGGGSSFHGKEFDGKTEMMEVLSRYKYYEHDQYFNKIMNDYRNTCDISDFIFGKPETWKV